MEDQPMPDLHGEENQLDAARTLKPPLRWHLRTVFLGMRIPLVILAVALGFYFVPQLQARKEQNALAVEFFAQCRKTLKDTAQLPKLPEEALRDAIRTRPLTDEAVRVWAPQVWTDIRNRQWVAHIRFSPPSGYQVDSTIGPVLAEAGYDTP